MPSSLPLDEYVTATTTDDGSGLTGSAMATIGPRRYGETWYVNLISTQVTSTAQSTLKIYRGVKSDTSIVAGTYSANFDTASGGSEIIVKNGDKLTFEWTGADIGVECQARLEGVLYSDRIGQGG